MLISDFDHRKYLLHTTPNGLDTLLIEDSNSRRCAVSAGIECGHFDDPDNCMGLMHLLEHMLFLGSKALPEPNAMSDMVSRYGGQINAWTASEQSNYHFEANHEYLAQVLTAFFDMLANPLFDEHAISMEIQSIDAEFKLKQKDDLRRLYQVHKETCNPAHPFSKFSVGNLEIFNQLTPTDLQTLLRQQHARSYVTGNMRLCIVSDHPLEDVRVLVDQLSAQLTSAAAPKRAPLPALYLPEQLGVQINIQPVNQAHRMIVSFAMPNTSEYYRSKPLGFISHVLGDEGDGSLLAYLKAQNWATRLSAGGGIQGTNFKDFNLNLQLTELGLDNQQHILNAIFHYISLMDDPAEIAPRLKEQVILHDQAFNFSDPAKALDDAIQLSSKMFVYPYTHLIASEHLLDKPDPDIITRMLKFMTPQNMRIKLIYPDAPTDREAKWYDTPYSVSPLNQETLKQYCNPKAVAELHLPEANPYLAEDTKHGNVEHACRHPQIICQQPGLTAWFGQDDKFMLPKGDCYMSFDCPAVEQGADVTAFKRILVAAQVESFGSQYYQASVAGLHYHLYAHQAGFTLHTNGFSQKQLKFCAEVLEQLHQPVDIEKYFEQVRNRQLQGLQNSLLNKPVNRLFTRLSVILQRYSYAPSDLLPIVERATPEDIQRTQSMLMQSYNIEMFIYGDWQQQQAEGLIANCQDHLSRVKPVNRMSRNIADLRHPRPYLHQVESAHEDAAVVMYLQSPGTDLRQVALTIITEQLLSSPFFNRLRTEKQLGYLVGSGYMPFNQHPGMAFYIQSPVATASTLINEINQFLQDCLTNLNQFSSYWEQIKSNVIKQLEEKDTNLSMKSQRLWMAIGNQDVDFSLQNRLSQSVQQLAFTDLRDFITDLCARNNFGELVLYCPAKDELSVEYSCEIIERLDNFKATAKYIT